MSWSHSPTHCGHHMIPPLADRCAHGVKPAQRFFVHQLPDAVATEKNAVARREINRCRTDKGIYGLLVGPERSIENVSFGMLAQFFGRVKSSVNETLNQAVVIGLGDNRILPKNITT